VGLGPADLALFTPDGMGGFFGYLNVLTDLTGPPMPTSNWAVQNIPLSFNSAGELSGRLPEGYTFDLGVSPGTNVPGLNFAASIDANPISSPATMGVPFAGGPVTVQPVNHVFGGFADPPTFAGGTEKEPPPSAQNTMGLTTGQMIHSKAMIGVMEVDVPAINEEINGCAPASAARSIHYLAQKFPALAMDLATNGETPQGTYDILKGLMNTQLGKGGIGTLLTEFKNGKDRYNNRLTKGSFMTMQIGGTVDDAMAAMDALMNMKDVEAMIYWGVNGQGRDMGGHAAFISEIIKIKDAQTGQIIGYQVSVIDDKTQGDGTANNTKTTYTFNAAGALKGYGAGGRMRGFQIEMWVPEPGGMMLAAVALLALGGHSRRRA
jgi:hypothetical protein